MEEANEFLKGGFRLRFNGSFAVSPKEAKSAFSPLLPSLKAKLPGILCLQEERTVGNDNCVSYHGKRLQIPPRPHRCHYVRAKVRVHEYRGRRDGYLPRHPEAGALQRQREAAGQGRGGGMSRSAAPLGSLRSPRRAAERKSGHFTCSENRTFYLLPCNPLRRSVLSAYSDQVI